MPGEDTHALMIEVARLQRELSEARTAAREEEKRADGWESTANANGELAAGHYSRWKDAESERDALRTALTEVNDLLMSVPVGEDWRVVVRKKVVVALFGEAAWKGT
jgi:hypothetical protein